MTFPTNRAKLALAAWLETHTKFRLSAHANDLTSALKELDTPASGLQLFRSIHSLKALF